MSELKYKVGDRVLIKDIDWYNKNKDEDGDVSCGEYDFVEGMHKFCSETLTISEDVGDGYLMLEDYHGYVWTDEMFECKVEKETKPKFKVGDKIKHKCDKNNTVITITGSKDDYYYIQYYNNKKNEYQNEAILFTDQDKYEMIEGLVEEETLIEKVDDNGLPFNEWLSHKGAFHVPEDYVLKDENGNVINASKIVLEKKSNKSKKSPKTDDIIKWLRERDMTKYIGVIYSGMCSITFDTEKLINDITEIIGDK